jgi:son of sevenless-like protein
MGMYLTDIVHVQDQLKDNVSFPLASAISPGGASLASAGFSPVYSMNSYCAGSSPSSETLTGPSLINFVKRQKWYDAVNTIMRYQNKSYGFAENPQIMNYIAEHLQLAISKDPASFWARSQELQQHEVAHADIRKGLEAAGF